MLIGFEIILSATSFWKVNMNSSMFLWGGSHFSSNLVEILYGRLAIIFVGFLHKVPILISRASFSIISTLSLYNFSISLRGFIKIGSFSITISFNGDWSKIALDKPPGPAPISIME